MSRDEDETLDPSEEMTERETARDAATPGGRRGAIKRNGKSSGSVNARAGVGFFPDGEVLPDEAELAWPEILKQLPAKGLSPYDVRISVRQIDPPGSNGQQLLLGGTIGGGAVAGSDTEDPGAALARYVTQYYHLPRAASQSAVTYQLIFATAKQQIARAKLYLPNRQEILALQAADRTRRAQEGESALPYMPPPPLQQPPMSNVAGVAAPPQFPQASPSMSPMDMWQMMRDVMSMQQVGAGMPPQMLDLMMQTFQQRLQQPQQAGVAAPPPVNEDAIVEKTTAAVVTTLAKLGVIRIPQPGDATSTTGSAGVASPPIAAVTPKSAMERAFDRVVEAAVGQFVGGIEKTIKQSITGVGAPPAEEAPPTQEAPAEPELPWKTMPVPGANWSNGSPIHYAENKDGSVSLEGLVMSNPVVIEKGFEVVTGLAGAAANVLKKIVEPKLQRQPPPTMMVGQPPPQMQAPQQTIDAPAEPKNDDWK